MSLSKLNRILITLLVLALGLIPSLLLMIWTERNGAIPFLAPFLMTQGFGLPWIYVEGGLAWSIGFNLLLIAQFGILHSALAARQSIPRWLYVVFTGLSSILILVLWQNTGVILYQLIPSAALSTLVSLLLFWTFLGLSVRSLTGVDSPAKFVGILQEEKTKTPSVLQTAGIYRHVRHPAYFFTLAAWFITPLMSLDRMIFALGMTVYLLIGVRIEERRLVTQFGEEYLRYRARTPMLLPRVKFGR